MILMQHYHLCIWRMSKYAAVVKFCKRQREGVRETDKVRKSEGELCAHLEFQCVGYNKGTSAAPVEL